MKLADRPYQHEAVHGGRGFPGIYRALRENRTALLVCATGTGKTIIFSRVAEACVLRGKRVLILAHREELIQGALEKLVRDTSISRLDIGIEMAGERAGDELYAGQSAQPIE